MQPRSSASAYITLFLILLLLLPAASAGILEFSCIDVGQGDALFLVQGSNTMLIDAGPEISSPTVLSYLKAKGVTRLDYLVATHPHEDHIGGMVDLLNAFPVGMYLDNGEVHTTSTYEELMTELVSRQIPYAEVRAGNSFRLGDATVEVLSPSSLSGDLNEDSIILRVTEGAVSFLLTGDAEDIHWEADILKVPHHGSVGSGTGIHNSGCSLAIIPVGAGNDYGHPAASTLNTLEKAGIQTLRTDLDGTIVVSTNGQTWDVSSSRDRSQISPTPGTGQISSQKITKISEIAGIPTPAQVYTSPVIRTGPCDCDGRDLDCSDFPTRVAAQNCFDYCKNQGRGDCFRLDGDNDCKVCESKA